MAATNDEVTTEAGDLTYRGGSFEFKAAAIMPTKLLEIPSPRTYEPCPKHPEIDEVLLVFEQAFCVPCLGVLLTTMMPGLKRRE